MKIVYYVFGAFIGFGCGSILNLVFYWLDQSGVHFADYLIKNFGGFGRFVLEMINSLPLFGVALGIILVKVLFGNQLDRREG